MIPTLAHLGLEPVKDVPILQVGGSSERASAFRTQGSHPLPELSISLRGCHIAYSSAQRILKRVTISRSVVRNAKNFLLTRRDRVKRITIVLIETTHFLKTRKEESKKLVGKYARQYNPQLEACYNAMVKLHDRVPLVTREGSEVQLKEALSRKPGTMLELDDLIDDSIVRELEKSGFIEKFIGKRLT